MSAFIKQRWFRALSGAVCLIFSWTSIAQSTPSPPDFSLLSSPRHFKDFVLPEDWGTVQSVFRAPDPRAPWIVHIQTVHADYRAQKRIEQLLEYLTEKYSISLALLEGASGELDPTLLKFFSDEDMNLAVADRLAQKGVLTGVELFALSSPEGFKAVGVEDVESYRENLMMFRQVMSKRKASELFLGGLTKQISRLIHQLENREFRETVKLWESFQRNGEDFYGLIRRFIALAKEHLNTDLTGAPSQFEWPQLVRLALLMEMQDEIDHRRGAQEMERLKEILQKQGVHENVLAALDGYAGKPKSVSDVGAGLAGAAAPLEPFRQALLRGVPARSANRDSINGRPQGAPLRPRDLFEMVYAVGGGKIDFEDFPALSRVAAEAIFRDELEAKALDTELHRLAYRLLHKLAGSAEEKKLVSLLDDLRLLAKVLRLELTRTQLDEIASRETFSVSGILEGVRELSEEFGARRGASDVMSSPRKRGSDTDVAPAEAGAYSEIPTFVGITSLSDSRVRGNDTGTKESVAVTMDKLFRRAMEFYRGADVRERAIVDNALSRMHDLDEGLTEEFRRRGISHIVITPQFEGVSQHRTHYLRNIMGSHKTIFDGVVGAPPSGRPHELNMEDASIEYVALLQHPDNRNAQGANSEDTARLVLSTVLESAAGFGHAVEILTDGFRPTALLPAHIEVKEVGLGDSGLLPGLRITFPEGTFSSSPIEFTVAFINGKAEILSSGIPTPEEMDKPSRQLEPIETEFISHRGISEKKTIRSMLRIVSDRPDRTGFGTVLPASFLLGFTLGAMASVSIGYVGFRLASRSCIRESALSTMARSRTSAPR